MKTLFQEETPQNNKTPGQTAIKDLFAENKESEPKTPNQVVSIVSAFFWPFLYASMKTLFQEETSQNNMTPGEQQWRVYLPSKKITGRKLLIR